MSSLVSSDPTRVGEGKRVYQTTETRGSSQTYQSRRKILGIEQKKASIFR